MSNSDVLAGQDPQFFGKDSFCPFIGQVEDVNDPLMSGRVKVRCVGWHPKTRKDQGGDDSLSTDDLPWARVGMPATHAQQSRIGGKHGLLPGCWVMGFFLDGPEAQDPFVLCSFSHSAKASEKDNRKNVGGTDGRLSDEAEGFDKVYTAESVSPNIRRQLEGEEGSKETKAPVDPAGDLPSLAGSDSDCEGKAADESVATKRQNKEELGKDGADNNAESDRYAINSADGLCGKVRHSATDIQKAMKERMPSQSSRFVYGDMVWNVISGDYMDINGSLASLAQIICSALKQPANAKKSVTEDQINRVLKSNTIISIPDRDGIQRVALDLKDTIKADMSHAGYQSSFIIILCMLLVGLRGGWGGGRCRWWTRKSKPEQQRQSRTSYCYWHQ